MDFFKLIQSLDELLYEVMSWLLFYPLTLWRMAKAPLKTMLAAEQEMAEEEHRQFEDMLGPPLFLFLTLVLIHAVELGLVGESEMVTSSHGLNALIDSDTNLVIYRILIVAILPLAAAGRLIRAQGKRIDRDALRGPFYAQCYVAAVFALMYDLAALLIDLALPYRGLIFGAVAAVSVAWLVIVETRWFAARLGRSWPSGLWQTGVVIAQWLAALLLVGLLLR